MDTNFQDTTGSSVSSEGRSRHEDKLTSEVEKRTANIPSITFLSLAGASILASATLFLMDKEEAALFVGEWAPTFLILGLYNKLVKQGEVIKPPMAGFAGH